MSKVLVIAPHPDDEVLGCGGTIRRMANDGHRLTVVIVTKGTPLFPESQVERVRSEARSAAELLGATLRFMDLPVTTLHLMPEAEINRAFAQLIREEEPGTVFLPFLGDRHEDHRQVFDAAMVAMRPNGRGQPVQRIACYETVSETHWAVPGVETAFEPNWYVDIGRTLEAKLAAMRLYESQLTEEIPARSLEAIEALARFRGSVMGLVAAEAFHIVRDIWGEKELSASSS